MIASHLICTTPRSGSTLFCGLLRSTGVAGRPESYFRRQDEQLWLDRWQIARAPDGSFDFRDYVQAATTAGSTPNGVFSVRVMWGMLVPLARKLDHVHPDLAGADLELLTRAFGRTAFIHLRRDDTVAQAVSWARAEQTGCWQRGDTAVRDPYFDIDQIHGWVKTIDEHNLAWRDWFTRLDIAPHVVRYEDLVADLAEVTRDVLDFLGLTLPPDRRIVPRSHQQADEISADWIARYRSVVGS